MLRIITINEEESRDAEITNKSIKTGEEQESQTIEWKWTWQEDYLKWLCGYANTDGGVLNIGVNDDGYVVGIEDSKKMLVVLPKIKTKHKWKKITVFMLVIIMVLGMIPNTAGCRKQ